MSDPEVGHRWSVGRRALRPLTQGRVGQLAPEGDETRASSRAATRSPARKLGSRPRATPTPTRPHSRSSRSRSLEESEPKHAGRISCQAAGEHERQVPRRSFRIYRAGVTEPVPQRGTLVLADEELLEDEYLWRDDDAGDHAGWWCVKTDPFPCPASGCLFVADLMTAAAPRARLAGARRPEPALARTARPEVGRNPHIVSYARELRAERLVLRMGGRGEAGARDQERGPSPPRV